MTSNIAMALLIGLYFGFTAATLVAFQPHRHPAPAAVASRHLPR